MNILFTKSEYYGTPRIVIVCGFTALEIHRYQIVKGNSCSYHCTISHFRSDDIDSVSTGSGYSIEEMWEDLSDYVFTKGQKYKDEIELEQYIVNNFAVLKEHLNT